eukprot:1183228-Prorocentrum_minimum.AAC.3
MASKLFVSRQVECKGVGKVQAYMTRKDPKLLKTRSLGYAKVKTLPKTSLRAHALKRLGASFRLSKKPGAAVTFAQVPAQAAVAVKNISLAPPSTMDKVQSLRSVSSNLPGSSLLSQRGKSLLSDDAVVLCTARQGDYSAWKNTRVSILAHPTHPAARVPIWIAEI